MPARKPPKKITITKVFTESGRINKAATLRQFLLRYRKMKNPEVIKVFKGEGIPINAVDLTTTKSLLREKKKLPPYAPGITKAERIREMLRKHPWMSTIAIIDALKKYGVTSTDVSMQRRKLIEKGGLELPLRLRTPSPKTVFAQIMRELYIDPFRPNEQVAKAVRKRGYSATAKNVGIVKTTLGGKGIRFPAVTRLGLVREFLERHPELVGKGDDEIVKRINEDKEFGWRLRKLQKTKKKFTRRDIITSRYYERKKEMKKVA